MSAVIIIERAVSHGMAKAKVQEIISKVEEMEKTIDVAVQNFNDHTSDSDSHVTSTLLDLLKERNEYTKKELADTRIDIRRVEDLLKKM